MEEILKSLKNEAVYFKLTSKPKFGGAVSLEDVMKVLKSLTDSYNAFITAEYDKVNTQQNKTKLNKIRRGLIEENRLVIVDLKFESFGMSVSPNFVMQTHDIPNINQLKKWKKGAFEDYKELVLRSDFNDSKFLDKVSNRFNSLDRAKIYKPIIDVIGNSESADTSFNMGDDQELVKISQPTQASYSILVPKPEVTPVVNEEPKTSMAMVEIRQG
ncbi:MAG: hypothetical protein AAGJ93_14865, partial [Bacteroidota bacterium]